MPAERRRIRRLGCGVAAILAHSWRASPPPLENRAEKLVAKRAPLLLVSGAGSLAWWRVRRSEFRTAPAALDLQDAYRLDALQAILHEQEIAEVLALLRSAGVEPILVKGWAAARLYPEPGLRPYGDVDLCCRPDQFDDAAAALRHVKKPKYYLNLHRGFSSLDELRWEELDARSQVVPLGGEKVRILAPEDHLRLLCVHLLRRGAWRPLWLCDVAVAVETRATDFDWDRCLSGNRRVADWVSCAIRLAHRALNVQVDDTPVAGSPKLLPRWLFRQVMRNWSAPFPDLYPPQSYGGPFINYIRRPTHVLYALRKRWPDPIEATITMRGPLNDWPRIPFQIGHYALRTGEFLANLPKLLKMRQTRHSSPGATRDSIRNPT